MSFVPLAPTPFLTADLPGIGGRIKVHPEDFEVEEIPAYPPSGEGEYLYLWIEKRSMGAEYFVRQIAQRLDIGSGEIGTAGLKDRHAVTRQMVSVPDRVKPLLGHLDGDGIRLLEVARHSNKLKPGHLHGNRFKILIRDTAPETRERIGPIVDRLRSNGMPNFYGPQRFGRDGETFRLGFEQLQAEPGKPPRRLNPFLRKLALSAAQSGLFNHYLAARMKDGLLANVIPGDVLAHWPQGGMFVTDDVEREQLRYNAHDIVPAGPIFGKKMYPARELAAEREAAILQKVGLTPHSFHGFGKLMQGTRRHNLVFVDDLSATVDGEGVRVSFTLPAGSYATVLIGEMMKCELTEPLE